MPEVSSITKTNLRSCNESSMHWKGIYLWKFATCSVKHHTLKMEAWMCISMHS